MMDSITAIGLAAAITFVRDEITLTHYQRITALCTLWSEGVQKPTVEQIEARISELRTAASFISAASAE